MLGHFMKPLYFGIVFGKNVALDMLVMSLISTEKQEQDNILMQSFKFKTVLIVSGFKNLPTVW